MLSAILSSLTKVVGSSQVELAKQLEQKKEQLRTIMRDLEIEKEKTDTLLYSMLPKEVANDLREGRTVEAGNSFIFHYKYIMRFMRYARSTFTLSHNFDRLFDSILPRRLNCGGQLFLIH